MALISDLGLIDSLVAEDESEVCLGMDDDDGVFGVASTRDLLSVSMAAVGIDAKENVLGGSLDQDTDALLNSILTGSNLESAFSDDSSCSLGMDADWMGKTDGADIDDVLQAVGDDLDEEECYDTPRMQLQVVNPVTFETTSNPAPTRSAAQTVTIRKITPSSAVLNSLRMTPTATIVLPAVTTRSTVRQQDRVVVVSSDSCSSSKRRRVSTSSSSDSGVDDASSTTTEDNHQHMSNAQRLTEVSGCVRVSAPASGHPRYPALNLSEEERRLCEREGLRLPTHYPLTREEEKNLKKIRRKIRNKVSAQDSRKRKKEYLDVMEVRVRKCSDENHELQRKVEQLERQNQSLAGQLQRLHQIIVNKGGLVGLLGGRQNQSQASPPVSQQPAATTGSAATTSTAMMVLLLSTALFLIPGINREQTDTKNEIDIFQAVKMPPIPGQSRSLLHFGTHVKQEYGGSQDAAMAAKADLGGANNAAVKAEPGLFSASDSPMADHDYFVVSSSAVGSGGKRKLEATTAAGSYIEEDVPALGYGLGKASLSLESPPAAATPVTASVEKRTINITRGDNDGGMRTVILHVPKEFHEVYIN